MPDVENVIEPILAAYIDQKKLQKLLEKMFGQEIVVYVSGQHLLHSGAGQLQLRLWLIIHVQSKNERFIFTAPRLLTEVSLPDLP